MRGDRFVQSLLRITATIDSPAKVHLDVMRFRTCPVDASPSPTVRKARSMLRTSITWVVVCVAVAVYAGVSIQPSVSYSVGASILGVAWACLLIIYWRTRSFIWSFFAIVVPLLGISILRDTVFPGRGFLRGIYGYAVVLSVGMLLLRIFRSQILRFCHLDRDEPIA
jgi:hypothetical protein